jgi:hypothetical protein
VSFAVSFEDFTPSPRFDGAPWTRVRIEESAAEGGPFTPIDEIDLLPVDENPEDPQQRSFTTQQATLASGWYQAVFLDDSGAIQPTAPIFHSAVQVAYTPGVSEVGAAIRGRTVDSNGNELGTFTAETRPTRHQAAQLIQEAVDEITDRYGASLPAKLETSARKVAKLRAAMLIELGFFGDQIIVNRGPYLELKKLHDEAAAALEKSFLTIGADEDPGSADDVGAGMPAYYFPAIETAHVPGSEFPNDW